jgi:hypothetical protein
LASTIHWDVDREFRNFTGLYNSSHHFTLLLSVLSLLAFSLRDIHGHVASPSIQKLAIVSFQTQNVWNDTMACFWMKWWELVLMLFDGLTMPVELTCFSLHAAELSGWHEGRERSEHSSRSLLQHWAAKGSESAGAIAAFMSRCPMGW